MENNQEKTKKEKKEKKLSNFKKYIKHSFLKLSSFLITLCILITCICVLIFCSTNLVKTKNINVNISSMDGIKIVHLSDFNGRIVKNLSKKVNDLKPDIVVITGDLVDEYKTSEVDENKLLKQFKDITTDIYFVPGDMEHSYNNYEKLKEKMKKNGFHVLENNSEKCMINNKTYTITGVLDPSFYSEDLELFNKNLKTLSNENNQILLSHRPELMNLYVENNYKFVLSGHTHGGYVKLPFVGAIFASNQGVMPNYVDGKYTKNGTTMIVSSGIGVGQFPFRFFSFPKILNEKIN